MKIQIIESNHMDYSSARVQFMLGSLVILACTFLLKNSISNILGGFSFRLLIDASTSVVVGLLFFEIANRYSNKLQATAAIWASFVWFFITIEWIPAANPFIGFVTLASVLPIFIYLRYLLLDEKNYFLYFCLALLLSLGCGLSSLIFSLSGTVLATIFLPNKYFSNPTISFPSAPQLNPQSKPMPLFVTLCTALAICYCPLLFLNNYAFSAMPNLASIVHIEWLAFALLLLVRLLTGKIFLAPLLFCFFWTAIILLPHPELQFFKNVGEANLSLVPLTYLLVITSLPVFDVLNKKHSLILALCGAILMSVFCFGKGVAAWNSVQAISQNDRLYESLKSRRFNHSGDSKICLGFEDLKPQLISGSNDITEISALDWITQDTQASTCWFEKSKSYLNLCVGPARRQPKGPAKTVSVNGYGLKNGVGIKLASVKINPREANNVKITLTFPLQPDTRVNWIWKGNNTTEFFSAPLKLIDNKILRANLKNEIHWLTNDSIEQIGIFIPSGSSSLAIEKIEL